MQIATWNVNSLNIRLPHVLAWLAARPVDVLCLQETKLTNDKFPHDAFAHLGYHSLHAGQKTYNGVALLARAPLRNATINLPGLPDEQQRLITATVGEGAAALRILCAYMPNGQAVGSDKFHYKLRWLDALLDHLRTELARHSRLALLGDFNIAPADADVHDPAAWHEQILCSSPERERFRAMVALGLTDSFRLFNQPPNTYSWWDYRQLGFQKNRGLRIDHILLSAALASQCTACEIDRAERKKPQPSDHAPVIATLT